VGWLLYNLVLQKISLLPADQTQPIQSVVALLLLLLGAFSYRWWRATLRQLSVKRRQNCRFFFSVFCSWP
jgi:uncharacterized membrane protein